MRKIKRLFSSFTMPKIDSTLDEDQLVLQQSFIEVKKYMREQKIKKMPLHLVIGPSSAGKSALLLHSELSFHKIIPPLPETSKQLISANNLPPAARAFQPQQEIEATQCYFWIHAKGIFLEVPGNFLDLTHTQTKNPMWPFLLKLLKQYRRLLPLQQLLIALALPVLGENAREQNQEMIQTVKARLTSLQQDWHDSFPVYIILTRCEKIKGFQEFFAELNMEERRRPLGFDLAQAQQKPAETPSISNWIHLQINELLDHLHSQLIARLHRERDLSQRKLIKNFPVQLELVQDILVDLIQTLFEKISYTQQISIQGIYFVSCHAAKEIVDYVLPSVQAHFPVVIKSIGTPRIAAQKTYFITQLLNKILYSVPQSTQTPLLIESKNSMLAASCMLAIAASLIGFFIFEWHKNSALIADSRDAVANYQTLVAHLPADPMPEQLLPAFTDLHRAKYDLEHVSQEFALTSAWQREQSLTQLANRALLRSLHNLLIPTLKQNLEALLQNPSTDTNHLYSLLKTYLMLGKIETMDAAFASQILLSTWKPLRTASPSTQQAMQYYLFYSLNNSYAPLPLNQEIIKRVRAKLNLLPKGYLAFLILKSAAAHREKPYMPLQNLQGTAYLKSEKSLQIPFVFTAIGFKQIFLPQAKIALQAATNGNSVLGSHTQPPLESDASKQLMQIYFQNALAWWKKANNAIQLEPPHTFAEAEKIASDLSNPDSPLQQTLQNIATNLQLILDTAKQNNYLSDSDLNAAQMIYHFDLRDFIDNHRVAFKSLANSLRRMVQDNGAEAFNFSKSFMQNQSSSDIPWLSLQQDLKNRSAGVQTFFSSFLNQCTTLIMQASAQYINNAWSNDVLPVYSTAIANHFPIFKEAIVGIPFEQFKQYFGYRGALAQFFQNYLAPFVDTDNLQWQLRTNNGISLPLNPEALISFERAEIIRKMFFNESDNSIAIQFSLQQIALEPVVKKFSLTLNGQSLQDSMGTKNVSRFIWPGDSGDQMTRIHFTDVDGLEANDEEAGPWSLFRILNKSELTQTENTSDFTVIFRVDGNEAKYRLHAENAVNPFIPGIIDSYRAPSSLLTKN